MRIGILGMGIGKVFAEVCQKIGYEVQVYDLDKQRCKGFLYNSDLIEDCQKIIVCLPDSFHYSFTKELLQRKKDVLLVKPATRSVEKLTELYELAQKNKVIFKVALNNRFRKEIPKNNWDLFMGLWSGDMKNVPNWRDEGDVWWDLGIHLVDLFLFTKKNDKQKGVIGVRYSTSSQSGLFVVWEKDRKGVSLIVDGIQGKFNDEYTFRDCVIDWLNTKRTVIDKNFLKAIEIISTVKDEKLILL